MIKQLIICIALIISSNAIAEEETPGDHKESKEEAQAESNTPPKYSAKEERSKVKFSLHFKFFR